MALIKELLNQPNWKDCQATLNVNDAVGESLKKDEPINFYGDVVVRDVKERIDLRFDGNQMGMKEQ
jgi:hypothetical protein